MVTGTRDPRFEASVFRHLRALAWRATEVLVIHGACRPHPDGPLAGADAAAAALCAREGLDEVRFPANFRGRGKSGGPFRNQLMLDLGKPEVVFAFPGPDSRGTWDAITRAKRAGIELQVHELTEEMLRC